MRVAAPGKLLLTGAYAVLEGAPALVVAVDWLAIASEGALDVRALYDDEEKLGLGSSAAGVVAQLGLSFARSGEDLKNEDVRQRLFTDARRAHAEAQGGGSGVDVAASVHGGVLRYAIDGTVARVALPQGVRFQVFSPRRSARTSELLARVAALRARSPERWAERIEALTVAARAAASATDAATFISAVQASARGLAELGDAADAPIVLSQAAALAKEADGEGAAFFPSGAGGGDVHVWLGKGSPSPSFTERALALGMRGFSLGIDSIGVRVRASED